MRDHSHNSHNDCTVIHNNKDVPNDENECNTDDDMNGMDDNIESSACSTPTFRFSSAAIKKVDFNCIASSKDLAAQRRHIKNNFAY